MNNTNGRSGLADRAATTVHPVTGRCSRETAVAYVIDAVESTGAATRNDFDIDRIVTTAHELADDWDLQTLTPDTFWRIAAGCIRY
ncbi:hypothetical protein NN3_61270 [Nocardia neocaledoniensis NBRC 108232]|uniref:Uncharacterized protein n=1 Tax=Nocardia neocaledoniensis TaxID=236511 RepID=A0A317NH70_9NOCA|nr:MULTISPECIES: hypothetical protein [Nocardia]PWV74243.1 hypothetical protein DFR69_10654 [Nocardia neocaledoniensis]UGT55618.1 hypothetical protein LTT85_01690 [Nocardia asteroides]GEM35120.1 hypothetical protein NN3_61270 [Nocardia neocaledoniensis NBRC 108232]